MSLLKFEMESEMKKESGLKIRMATAAAITFLGLSATGAAQAADNAYLEWANALAKVYKAEASAGTTKSATDSINKSSTSSVECKELNDAKAKAAEQYIMNKLPPDPTTVIAKSTCFLDVMDITIPTSGTGFLGSIMGFLSPFVSRSTICDNTKVFWDDIKSNVTSGKTGDLLNMTFSTAKEVSAAQGGATSTTAAQSYSNASLSYSNILSGSFDPSKIIPNMSGGSTPGQYSPGAGSGSGNSTYDAYFPANTTGGSSLAGSSGSMEALNIDLLKEIEDLRAKLGL